MSVDKTNLKRASDYNPKPFEGLEMLPIDQIFGKDVIVYETKKMTGSFGEFLAIRCELDDKMFYTQTGAAAVLTKIANIEKANGYPVLAQFVTRTSQKTGQEYIDMI